MDRIPFNKPYFVGAELDYLRQAIENMHLSGDGPFTRSCQSWLEEEIGCRKALLTHSCTGALEMAAILLDVGPGDEVIMPSFTFVSTANAFVLRGATPVFVDVRPDTLNLDETKVEAAITAKTRAVVVVDYAGVGCEMEAIGEIAERRGLVVVEDAAQGLLAQHAGRPLGSFGALATLSFHETKNVHSGEAGALLVNNPDLVARAEIVREKGTNRSQFFRGEVDKYTWVDIGSSYLPNEITAAFLWAQLEVAGQLTERRLELWHWYQERFAALEAEGLARRPEPSASGLHNGHIYHLRLADLGTRERLIAAGKQAGFDAVFHYVPLHSSPAGRRYGRASEELPVTDHVAERLVRLPLWVGMTAQQQEHVARVVERCLRA